jgi:hypothetical protein
MLFVRHNGGLRLRSAQMSILSAVADLPHTTIRTRWTLIRRLEVMAAAATVVGNNPLT